MTMKITKSTEPQHVGQTVQCDLLVMTFDSETITLTGRAHVGNGLWKLWNSDYFLEAQEII